MFLCGYFLFIFTFYQISLMKLLFISGILFSVSLLAQNSKHILISNGLAHIGNGNVVENSYVAIKDGKIEMVADARLTKIDVRQYDTVINASGKHVYPGLIAPNCILGLQEAEAVRQTSDYNETGDFNPHIRSLIAYNTDSKIIETVKLNGVLYTQSTPRGGVISGMSSIFATGGWNWEDAVLKADDGIHLNFPQSIQKRGWWAEQQPSEKNNRYSDELKNVTTFFDNALAYSKAEKVLEKNLRFEAMRDVFAAKKNLYIHTDYVKDIIIAVNFVKKYNLKKVVIIGGKDSYKVTRLLRENNIAVMLNRLHDLPDTPESETDLMYKLPALLQKDSVLFCLQNQGDMEAMNARNIPFIAGTAVAYGLTKEEALQSITLNSAKILGIDHLVGSLEVGKQGSLVISEGDILDMKSNNIVMAFVNGKQVNLHSFQKDLYLKYMNKYKLKE